MTSRSARALCSVVIACAALACGDGSTGRGASESAARPTPTAAPANPSARRCSVPDEGCACEGSQAPVPCVPSSLGASASSESLCFEGTRTCRDGVFGACEDVQAFARPTLDESALIDAVSQHPRCTTCDVSCFRVLDPLSPDDGPLGSAFAQNLQFHGSGAGITLRPASLLPINVPTPPGGGLLVQVLDGMTGSAVHRHEYRPRRADVYLLADHSLSMAEEIVWLHDRFTGGARYLDGTARCTNGDQGLIDEGVSGAVRCMIEDAWFGSGIFRDIPFEPYATDTTLPLAQRERDAMNEIAFRQRAYMSSALNAAQAFGAFESSGNPDIAGSQIPALYMVATGQGMFAGLGRTSVPDGPRCGDGEGYPCFRSASERIVVLLTDAPMHNGPDVTSLSYDYDPATLTTLVGTGPGALTVPETNESWSSAFHLTSDAGNELVVALGNSGALRSDIPAAQVACGAIEGASDAVFSFDVISPEGAGSTADVTLSAEGTQYLASLAVFDGPPQTPEVIASAGDVNELFTTSRDLGDVSGRNVRVPGDTTSPAISGDMGADYQGSLFGAACGANTLAPDAVFSFDVDGSAAPVQLALSADMGGQRAVLSVYREGHGPLPRWPATTTPLVATGNSDAFPANVFTIPSDAGSSYVTVTGDTSALGSDYNAVDVGAGQCNPDSASMDAAFQIHVSGQQTLRFDTEGSSFDTVLSLHDRPPLTKSGAVLRWPAADTHQNLNEDSQSAYDVGVVNGLSQVFEGDTTGMQANVSDTFSCGTDGACGDAVYRITVSERTTLRLQVDGSGFEPGVFVTRESPNGVSGNYGPLAAGGRHTCAISGGEVFCWGADDQGQLGNGGALGAADSSAAVRVSGLTDVLQVCAGSEHSCAVTQTGQLRCWGNGAQGRLGNGDNAVQVAPVLASDIGEGAALGPAVQVTCGDAFSCALLADGRIACFGDNTRNQLGDGTTTERRTPVVVSSAEPFEQLDAGSRHACAVRASDNAVFCWGEGAFGKLGDNGTTNNPTPARVGTLIGATHVMAGGGHSCAVLSSGRVSCWGQNNVGQLGLGTTDSTAHTNPSTVRNADGSADLANVRGSFAAGGDHTCVATIEGYAMCWGGNSSLEIGHNDSATPVTRPIGVSNVLDALQVFAGYDHTCALRASGSVSCWGSNADAQLGDGTVATPGQPVRSQAGAGSTPVSYGTGTLDAAFTQACRSIAQPPEQGCVLRQGADHSYFFCNNQPRTWAGAAQSCEAVGMQLASIDSVAENAFIASRLDAGEQAWIGVKRESSDDWLQLSDTNHFETLDGERVWYTDRIGQWGCSDCVRGYFTGPAADDLVNSSPYWTTSSTWARNQPSTDWGHNCVTVGSNAQWQTANCSALVEPTRDCGFLGLRCLLGLLGDLVGGLFDWIVPWLGDLTRLVFDSLAGEYAAPQFSGGADRPYVCEEVERTTEVTLDPGEYFITVKGVDDGVAGNACEGSYALQLTDLGTPGGGLIACDDDSVAETTNSVLQRTLSEGDYTLILKGKRASDAGDYRLTVRDVGAVATSELACDASGGAGDPASAVITATPGERYYALVKGDAPLDKGAFNFSVRDLASAGGQQLGCDASSGPTGDPELMLALEGGTYYAVLKGRGGASQAGYYQLSVGSAQPVSDTFVPPSYQDVVDELVDQDIRVASVLSCNPALTSCADARAQAQQLADDTAGAMRVAATAQDVPLEIVRAIEQIEAADRVSAVLAFAPDANPGFTPYSVTPVPDAGNRCTLAPDGQSFVDCAPGAMPAFEVTLHNPALAPVPPATGPLGLYELTLEVTTERAGSPALVEDVPIFVHPSGTPPEGSYTSGTYFQDFDARGCTIEGQRASWDELLFDADVRPDTSVAFLACSADTEEDLDACEDGVGAGSASGERRVLTITAGSGLGTPCTVATQVLDCPDGYCSAYVGVCNYLEGASCIEDADCPGEEVGRCRMGPSAGTLGRTCRVYDNVASPASALDGGNMHEHMRMKLELESRGDRTRTPSVFFWETRYRCRSVE